MATADGGGVDVVLWDFGDTLVDERWCWQCPPGVPGWTDAWRACGATELWTRWGRGDAVIDDVAAQLADATGMSAGAVVTHLASRFRDLTFHPRTWEIARAREHRQAIVTVNPVEFRDIVATYELDRVFDLIVISGEEHTDDKADLCDRALERVGITDRAESLLIDNIESNIMSWRSRGGRAYWYRDDQTFADDLAARGWRGLVPAIA
jgi:FMN phosphatase YigB (HAD superfamily)